MLVDQANPDVVRRAVEQYATLIEVERGSGVKTNRTRNQILQTLAPAELIAVSLELKRRGLIGVAR